MALSADLISLTEPFFYYKFSALALATSLLTLLTVGPMCDQTFGVVGCVTNPPCSFFACRFLVDWYRSGSLFSYIIVEISWLCKPFFLFPSRSPISSPSVAILWVLWLSSGAYAAWTDQQLIDLVPEESSCDFGLFSESFVTWQSI